MNSNQNTLKLLRFINYANMRKPAFEEQYFIMLFILLYVYKNLVSF